MADGIERRAKPARDAGAPSPSPCVVAQPPEIRATATDGNSDGFPRGGPGPRLPRNARKRPQRVKGVGPRGRPAKAPQVHTGSIDHLVGLQRIVVVIHEAGRLGAVQDLQEEQQPLLLLLLTAPHQRPGAGAGGGLVHHRGAGGRLPRQQHQHCCYSPIVGLPQVRGPRSGRPLVRPSDDGGHHSGGADEQILLAHQPPQHRRLHGAFADAPAGRRTRSSRRSC